MKSRKVPKTLFSVAIIVLLLVFPNFLLSASERAIQVTPDQEKRSNIVEVDGYVQRYQVPGAGDRFSLKVTPPYGQERIVVYASETPMGDIPMTPLGGGLQQYRGSNEDLAFRVRSIQPVERISGDATSGSTGFYEASWVVETGP